MLKIGKVYSSASKLFYIADKFKRKSKTTYIGQRVYPNGSLGPKHKIKYNRKHFKLQSDIKVKINIIMPKAQVDLARFLSLLDSAIGHLELLEAQNWRNKGLKIKIGELAWAASYYYNHDEGRQYNIRDFSKQLGFSRASRIYPWVADFLKGLFTEDKYENAIPDCADSTLVSQVRAYSKYWKSYHGFSKKLDSMLENDLRAYTSEITKRGLQPYV